MQRELKSSYDAFDSWHQLSTFCSTMALLRQEIVYGGIFFGARSEHDERELDEMIRGSVRPRESEWIHWESTLERPKRLRVLEVFPDFCGRYWVRALWTAGSGRGCVQHIPLLDPRAGFIVPVHKTYSPHEPALSYTGARYHPDGLRKPSKRT